MKLYDGKVNLIFKHFPLDFHPWAMKAALATETVFQMKPDLFWDLHDQIFSAQKEITVDNIDSEVESFLKANKIDVAEFKKKMESDSVKQAIARDAQEGKNAGTRGTPAFYIDGRFLNGAQPLDKFKQTIDDALASYGIAPPTSSAK